MSYNYGAGNAKRAKDGFKLLLKCSMIYSCTLWALVMLFPRGFAGMFTTDAELLVFTGRLFGSIWPACLCLVFRLPVRMAFNSL